MKPLKLIFCICFLFLFVNCAHHPPVKICQDQMCSSLKATSQDALFLKLTQTIKANLEKEVPLMIGSRQDEPANKGTSFHWSSNRTGQRYLQINSLKFIKVISLDEDAREAKVMAHVHVTDNMLGEKALEMQCILTIHAVNWITLEGRVYHQPYYNYYLDALIDSIDIDRGIWSSAFRMIVGTSDGKDFNPTQKGYMRLSFSNPVTKSNDVFVQGESKPDISKAALSHDYSTEHNMSQIQTIIHTVRQPFGGSQSADDARTAAMAKAKREALEKAGVYIEKLTVVKNSQVEKNEILALTANVLKTEIVSQKNYASEESFGIEVMVKITIDDTILDEKVKKQLQNKEHLEKIKDDQAREKELLQRIVQLEEQNRKKDVSKHNAEKLKKEFHEASQVFKAMDWFNKAGALWDGEKYADATKAIEYFNAAIKLEPTYANAYNSRGEAYSELGQYQLAIKDYSEAIKLKPDDFYYITNRAVAYNNLGMYQAAVDDYSKVLRLKPDYALAYHNRGVAYNELGQHQLAIVDFSEAIRLKPDYANAYNNRGTAYNELGKYQRAIEDFDKAIRLKPDSDSTLNNRAVSYNKLGHYQLAIKDYSEAIRLKPKDIYYVVNRSIVYNNLGMYQAAINDCNDAIHDNPEYALAYRSRGYAFLSKGDSSLGCSDARKACELGDCNLWQMYEGKGICH